MKLSKISLLASSIMLYSMGSAASSLIVDMKFKNSLQDDTGIHSITKSGNGSFVNGGNNVSLEAYKITGDDSSLQISKSNHLNNLNQLNRSISLWVKAPANPTSGREYILYEEGGQQDGLNIYYKDGEIYANIWAGAGSAMVDLKGTYPAGDKFHHIALVFQYDTIKKASLYLNGTEAQNKTTSFQLWGHPFDDTGVGGIQGKTTLADGSVVTSGLSADGWSFESLRIYNRPLQLKEIQYHAKDFEYKTLANRYSPRIYQQVRQGFTPGKGIDIGFSRDILIGDVKFEFSGKKHEKSYHPQHDVMGRVNFDGDWDSGNNWENMELYSKTPNSYVEELKPAAYYSVTETADFYFINYYIYHAKDDANLIDVDFTAGGEVDGIGGGTYRTQILEADADRHENDIEEIILAVSKSDNKVKAAVSQAHGYMVPWQPFEDTNIQIDELSVVHSWIPGIIFDMVNFFKNGALDDAINEMYTYVDVSDKRGTFDYSYDTNLEMDGDHPKFFISGNGVGLKYGHGIVAYDSTLMGRWYKGHDSADQGILLKSADSADAVTLTKGSNIGEFTNTDTYNYELINVSELWDRRDLKSLFPNGKLDNTIEHVDFRMRDTRKSEDTSLYPDRNGFAATLPIAKQYTRNPVRFFQEDPNMIKELSNIDFAPYKGSDVNGNYTNNLFESGNDFPLSHKFLFLSDSADLSGNVQRIKFDPFVTYNLSELNNNVASFRLPPGKTITLYDHHNLGGESITRTNSTNQVQIFNVSEISLDMIGKISAFRILNNTDAVRLYDHQHEMGRGEAVPRGATYHVNQLQGVGDNAISRVVLPPNTIIRMWADNTSDEGHSHIDLYNNTNQDKAFDLSMMNNKVSTIKSWQTFEQDPQDKYVKLYNDWNGTGDEFVFKAGHIKQYEVGSFNDVATSLVVPPRTTVTLFQHSGCLGVPVTFVNHEWESYKTWNITQVGPGENDKASCLRIYDTGEVIVLYKDYNQTGYSVAYTVGEYLDVPGIGNDAVTSYFVPAGRQLQLFNDWNHTGTEYWVTGLEWGNVFDWFNDKTTSFKVH